MHIESLDIKSLPRVRLSDRRNLPDVPGVYFVVDDRDIVYYIGRSKSIASRWGSHDKTRVFEDLAQKAQFFIHYLQSDDHERIEKDAIRFFDPLLNQRLRGDTVERQSSAKSRISDLEREVSEIKAIVDLLKRSQGIEFEQDKLPVTSHNPQLVQSNIFGGVDLLKGQQPLFTPSEYQQRIFDWIQYGTGDAIVAAVAGSGKTTTLIEAAKLIKTDGVCRFLAFNGSIAKELKKRLPSGAIASTIHSLGAKSCHAAFGRLDFNEQKYIEIIKSNCQFKDWAAVRELCFKARTQAIGRTPSKEEILFVAQRFGIHLESPSVLSDVAKCIEEGVRLFIEKQIVDYADQVWLPSALNLSVARSQFMMVDECQDLNPAQLSLVMKSKGNGRALWVGDASQSIYYFAGAASDSIDKIKEATGAKVLPLSISYRCAKSIVDKAREFDDSIEPAPCAPCGSVIESLTRCDLIKLLAPGDLVICRRSLPLIESCMQAIAFGKNAKLVGEEDFKKRLLKMLDKLMLGRSFSELEQAMLDKINERGQELNKKDEREASAILISIYKRTKPQSLEEMKKVVKNIFTDGTPKIRFSTIHKAKGLEADRVFVLEWKTWHSSPTTEEERQQEKNLRYVAVTRAKSSLYLM